MKKHAKIPKNNLVFTTVIKLKKYVARQRHVMLFVKQCAQVDQCLALYFNHDA